MCARPPGEPSVVVIRKGSYIALAHILRRMQHLHLRLLREDTEAVRCDSVRRGERPIVGSEHLYLAVILAKMVGNKGPVVCAVIVGWSRLSLAVARKLVIVRDVQEVESIYALCS